MPQMTEEVRAQRGGSIAAPPTQAAAPAMMPAEARV